MNNWLLQKILIVPAVLIGLTVHEYAHAVVADRLGDKTPKFQGRLTLNPFVHVDIIGFLMIILIGFGWAKPIETNPNALKNRYKDDLKVSFAGPFANLILAFIGALCVGIIIKFGSISLGNVPILYSIIMSIFYSIVSINCMLFVFNLIPIPGLDGFHILRDLFPSIYFRISDSLYRYQLIILIIFVATPLANYIVGVPSSLLYGMFMKIVNLMM
ncbi:site-2 protease family protein [Clostridium fermenticellae]|uniref:Site-2 protease family protein n=1 Tax=Clostridium fermenticellae TaxID=2068654 RepID=A0A386H2G2_9CLOT|nr:site-2 protease family protein [Clostridium fermenticellae]AYD39892.1 site-2 protease family protein [Clostridium fermenticellae]